MVLSSESSLPVARPSFVVPPEDFDEFYALPAAVQSEVKLRLKAMETISNAKSVRAGSMSVAVAMAGRAGWSPGRLRNQHAEYYSGGNWRTLLNRAKAGPTHYRNSDSVADLPAAANKAFREWVAMMIERCARNGGQAYREIINQWRRWRAGDPSARIPGFSVPPEPAMHGFHPVGWSRDNIMRMSPDIADLTRARIGQSAAMRFSPSILTTRAQMRCGQFYEHDDVMLDVMVNYPGQRTAVRPRGFFTNDSLTTFNTLISFKPYLWDIDESKRQDLTEREFFWTFIQNLLTNGYRTDEVGTTNLLENAKATIRDHTFLESLERDTNGSVRVLFGSIHGHKQLAGYFEGRGHGNPRHKARREQLFNLVHNYLQLLPGQTGKDRDHAPEQLHGAMAENRRELDLIARLSSDRADLVQTEFMPWDKFMDDCLRLCDEMDSRHNHEMEGWAKAGFVAEFVRMVDGGQWISKEEFESYAAKAKAAVMEIVKGDPKKYSLVRPMSPKEAWLKHQGELTKLKHVQLPSILAHRAEEFGRPVRVRNGFFEVQAEECGPDSILFHAMDGRRGSSSLLPEGEKYFGFFNPYHPDHLVTCDARMRPVAVCPLWDRVDPADSEAVMQKMGKKASHDAARHRRQDARHITFAMQHSRALAHNKALREGKPVTAEGRAHARDLAERVATEGAAAAADIFTAPEAPLEPAPAGDDISGEDFLSAISTPRD